MSNSLTVSRKLSLFPRNTSIDDGGQLCLGQHRLTDLAAQYGSPLYVYDVGTIQHQIKSYRQALTTYPDKTQLTYASKAFLCKAMAALMAEAEVGLDVASAGELFIAQHGGANPATMHLHGNNKTVHDLEYALKSGIGSIVVDNAEEVSRLKRLVKAHQTSVNVWLRINPDVTVETRHRYTVTGTADSKFGLPLDEAEEIAAELLSRPTSLHLTGLHLHLGSHFDHAGPVNEALSRLLDLAARLKDSHGWQLLELCPGGGWGVPYHPDEAAMPIRPFVTALTQAVALACQTRQLPLPTLILEPGRSLVAQAGVAVYTVGGRKVRHKSRPQISVDGGLADNPRPALYQAKYTALLANRANEPETETVSVVGPHCESGDILIQAVELPIPQPDDLLAVPVAGAYHLSMGSNYNAALRPAVLFIDQDEVKLVQRRERLEDLVQRDVYSS